MPSLLNQGAALVVHPGNQKLCQTSSLGTLTMHVMAANDSLLTRTYLPSCRR